MPFLSSATAWRCTVSPMTRLLISGVTESAAISFGPIAVSVVHAKTATTAAASQVERSRRRMLLGDRGDAPGGSRAYERNVQPHGLAPVLSIEHELVGALDVRLGGVARHGLIGDAQAHLEVLDVFEKRHEVLLLPRGHAGVGAPHLRHVLGLERAGV